MNDIADGLNDFVNIMADENSITCLFTKYQEGVTDSLLCNANIRYGPDCQQMLPNTTMGKSVLDDTVLITLDFLPEVQEYCFVITASDEATVVNVEGKFIFTQFQG